MPRATWADLAAIASSLQRAGVETVPIWTAIHQEAINRVKEAAQLPPVTSGQTDSTPPRLRVCLRSLATLLVAEGPASVSLSASQLIVSSVPVMTRLLERAAVGDYEVQKKVLAKKNESQNEQSDDNLQALTMLLVSLARHRVRDAPALTALNEAIDMANPPVVWSAQLASTAILASGKLAVDLPSGSVNFLSSAIDEKVDDFTLQVVCNALYGLALQPKFTTVVPKELLVKLTTRLIVLLDEFSASASTEVRIEKEAYKQIASVAAALLPIDQKISASLSSSLEKLERPTGVPTLERDDDSNVIDCAMSGLQRRVGMALKRMKLPENIVLHPEYAVKEGYEIDFALKKQYGDDKLAIEVDGPAHFYRLAPAAPKVLSPVIQMPVITKASLDENLEALDKADNGNEVENGDENESIEQENGNENENEPREETIAEAVARALPLVQESEVIPQTVDDVNSRRKVEEKFGEHNFPVFSDMRGKILYIDPLKIKKLDQNILMKMQKSTLPKFEISIFEKFGFEKMRNLHLKFPNLKFDFEFQG